MVFIAEVTKGLGLPIYETYNAVEVHYERYRILKIGKHLMIS